jgi:hypothetical protein
MAKRRVIVPPLSAGYMLSSMLGFFVSIFFVSKYSPPGLTPDEAAKFIAKYSIPWTVAFCVVFAVMFLAAVKSMTFTEPDMFVEMETKKKKKIRP